MAGKKKAGPTKGRTLAGEAVFSSVLAPAEERVFKETVTRYRDIALKMKEDFDRFSGAAAMGQSRGTGGKSLRFVFL